MRISIPKFSVRSINWRARRTWVIVGGVAIAVIAIILLLTGGSEPITTAAETPVVKVARIADLMSGKNSLSVIAEITSVSEAKISPEAGGKITRVRASLGAFVTAGQVLAEIENSSQRAALLQAEGAFDAAKAARQKLQGGTREEQIAIKQSALKAAQSGGVNTLLSSYAAVESAMNDAADPLFTNPTIRPAFNIIVTTSSQTKIDLENQRPSLTVIMARQSAQASSVSESSDIKGEMTRTEDELRTTRNFLDMVLKALNTAVPSTDTTQAEIDAYKASVSGARTSITTSLSAIASSRSGLETAEKNLEEGVTGAVSEDLASADASVKQAQGAYNAALASLEKTIIRSPIAGSLNNFTVKLGDTVSPAQQIAIVSNNGALEALAYVTEEDKAQIAVGKKVTFEGNITGTITRIAPALDPVTRRIEIRIGLPANATKEFTNGQSVRVELANETGAATKPIVGPIAIPLTALKMEATRTTVFVVENEALVAKEIKIGRLSGDSVQVAEGLTVDTEIVVDARGHKEGEKVAVTRE